VIVGRNHVNQKKAHFCEAAMEFHRLTAAFFAEFGQYEEILTKEERPYYVLLLELDGLTYAIPLRSHIKHPYCFIADNSAGQNSGLDYSKAVIITNSTQYIDPAPVTIRQHEFNVLKQREYLIRKQFSTYVATYKKEIRRRMKNPALPVSALCRYASLKYFHNELGLC
jgi:protein AbiQ